MLEQSNVTARLRATIEEELGTFRHFAHVPSADLEEMAARLARVVAPFLKGSGEAAVGQGLSQAEVTGREGIGLTQAEGQVLGGPFPQPGQGGDRGHELLQRHAAVQADVAVAAWAGEPASAPILEFKRINTSLVRFGRVEQSRHNLSAPDLVFHGFATAAAR